MLDGLLVVGVVILDGVAWPNAIGIWLLMFFNILLLKKSWSWPPMSRVNNTNIFDIQLVPAAADCKTILLFNDK